MKIRAEPAEDGRVHATSRTHQGCRRLKVAYRNGQASAPGQALREQYSVIAPDEFIPHVTNLISGI